jgi:hypothetical protein
VLGLVLCAGVAATLYLLQRPKSPEETRVEFKRAPSVFERSASAGRDASSGSTPVPAPSSTGADSRTGVEVWVTDPAGTPVSGARILWFVPAPESAASVLRPAADLQTDDRGRSWIGSDADTRESGLVVVNAAGFLAESKDVGPSGGVQTVRIALQPGAVLRGRTVDRTGRPLAGVAVAAVGLRTQRPLASLGGVVRFAREESYGHAVSDARGTFEVAGLEPERHRLVVLSPDWSPDMRELTAPVSAVPGSRAAGAWDAVLKLRTVRYVGMMLVDATTNEPLARVPDVVNIAGVGVGSLGMTQTAVSLAWMPRADLAGGMLIPIRSLVESDRGVRVDPATGEIAHAVWPTQAVLDRGKARALVQADGYQHATFEVTLMDGATFRSGFRDRVLLQRRRGAPRGRIRILASPPVGAGWSPDYLNLMVQSGPTLDVTQTPIARREAEGAYLSEPVHPGKVTVSWLRPTAVRRAIGTWDRGRVRLGEVDVQPGKTVELSATLPSFPAVRLHVQAGEGRPLAWYDAYVTQEGAGSLLPILRGGRPTSSGWRLPEQGADIVVPLDPGRYKLVVTKPGFAKGEQWCEVTPDGGVARAVITLHRR